MGSRIGSFPPGTWTDLARRRPYGNRLVAANEGGVSEGWPAVVLGPGVIGTYGARLPVWRAKSVRDDLLPEVEHCAPVAASCVGLSEVALLAGFGAASRPSTRLSFAPSGQPTRERRDRCEPGHASADRATVQYRCAASPGSHRFTSHGARTCEVQPLWCPRLSGVGRASCRLASSSGGRRDPLLRVGCRRTLARPTVESHRRIEVSLDGDGQAGVRRRAESATRRNGPQAIASSGGATGSRRTLR